MYVNDMCANCRTGLDSLILDPQSPVCPYLDCIKEGKCSAYVPIYDTNDNNCNVENEE